MDFSIFGILEIESVPFYVDVGAVLGFTLFYLACLGFFLGFYVSVFRGLVFSGNRPFLSTQGTSIQQNSVHYLPRKGGGGCLRTIGLKIICSKSNSITFYMSLGMRNQVETQKERSQGTSLQQNSMHYLPRGGSENNRFENNLLQIQFYHVL